MMTSDGDLSREIGRDLDPDLLDGLIDDVLAGQVHAADAQDGGELAAPLLRVHALTDEPLPEASRTRHLLAIRTHEPAEAARRPAGTRRRRVLGGAGPMRRRLVPIVAGSLSLLLFAGGGTVAAAQDADPDDALYGMKRASEQVWLAMPRGSERAAEVHLTLASRRLGEAQRMPAHAERLVAEGTENVEKAADELPEEAIDNFIRLLGDGPDSLPANASPMARAALHRNCVRIATKHGLGPERCGDAPDVEHPGRGQGRGMGDMDKDGPRGWGPGGRPDGEVGPPPGAPGQGRGWGPGGRPDGEVGPPPGVRGQGRGWGPGGRPEGAVGPPPGVPGNGQVGDLEDSDG